MNSWKHTIQFGLRSLTGTSHGAIKKLPITPQSFKYSIPIQVCFLTLSCALTFQTRWGDNDQYGHINNVIYYAWVDTVVNHFLIKHAGFDPKGAVIGLCVASSCSFYAPLSYPEVVLAGLRISKLGKTSVTYEGSYVYLSVLRNHSWNLP
jgi:hypothetical protein